MFSHGQSLFETPTNKESEFFAAVQSGKLPAVQEKIKQIENINCKNSHGDTALHIAAREGYLSIAKLLVEAGADVNAANPHIIRLYAASKQTINEKEPTEKVEEVAKINLGYTPLHLAAEFNHFDMANYLLENGARVDALDGYGYTPLYSTLFRGYAEVAKLLLDYKADPNLHLLNQASFLHMATRNGHYNLVKVLVENGANIDSTRGSFRKETALHTAMIAEYYNIAAYLIEQGADQNIQDEDGIKPIAMSKFKNVDELNDYVNSWRYSFRSVCSIV